MTQELDVDSLWDFEDPAASLARFRTTAAEAPEPTRSVLLSQAARALGLLGRLDEASAQLDALPTTDQQVRVRIALERGRLLRSSGAEGSREGAEAAFHVAAELSQSPRDDVMAGLHVDALHMVALLPERPSEQLAATRNALHAAESLPFPRARRWQAPLLNNLGFAQHEAGDDRAALESFEQALVLRQEAAALAGEEGTRPGSPQRRAVQVARWCRGWALRQLGRTDEALAVQRELGAELATDGIDDRYVAEELALLEGRG